MRLLNVKTDIPRTHRLAIQLFRSKWLSLGLTFLLIFFLETFFNQMARLLQSSEQGPLAAQLGLLATDLLESFMTVFIISHFIYCTFRRQVSFGEFFFKTVSPLVSETLRAYAQILLFSLLLIVPGVYKYFRLILVPYVVLFDPKYDYQQEDSLAISYAITQPFWLRLALLLIVIGAVQFGLELAPNWLALDSTTVKMIFSLIDFVISAYSFLLVYLIFERGLKNIPGRS